MMPAALAERVNDFETTAFRIQYSVKSSGVVSTASLGDQSPRPSGIF